MKQMIRDQFTIETWLCLGATLQSILFLVGGRITLIPALAYVLYRFSTAIAMSKGWIHNAYQDGIIVKKVSAVFPDELGNYGSKPSNSDIVVFHIGTRNNHPMGLLAPGWETIGKYFQDMSKVLDENREEFGLLGQTGWINAADRETAGEFLIVCYFRNVEGLHKFAHSKHHRDGWDWWNKTYSKHSHLAIYHETYHVPAGNWESIHVNSHISGINSMTFPVTDKESGEVVWARPIVDASQGLLKTSAGRMSRSKADEHEKYGQDPYDV